ncbi:MAG: chromosome partitioning protein [Chloroflexi bacterium AL-W]|nr:chromosome partitioning protein [Chloroflexi bacterium AL-N1]NOK71079.1 chromosome partitioning protein [Chloroflexi bacterium AL-N10]NOK72699.1 chromosome partitioning protein [Chloroflexi bacterium AL-N5]NOK79213.1 chromosome partitioning protein [Chloroflexi bacterium AL-W]NOK87129.1 chromosome partitioning protein [Chloroflexi bacterium AL-N15]
MTTILFTGNSSPSITLAAAATAIHSADQGRNTLFFSFGTPQRISALFGLSVGDQLQSVVANLDVLALDAATDVSELWERERGNIAGQLTSISGDELPLLPGADALFGFIRLSKYINQYDDIIFDAGPYEPILRALALPDSLRWGVRLLFGLDREPGRNQASLSRSVLPTSFIPVDTRNSVQEFRVQTEQSRDEMIMSEKTRVRYVLHPDAAGFEESRLIVSALQLHGLSVSTILVGPLFPDGMDDMRLNRLRLQEASLLKQVQETWVSRTLRTFVHHDTWAGMTALHELGTHIAVDQEPMIAPILKQYQNRPAVVIDLPNLPKSALKLTISGDDLIVRVGAYRRHILLPKELRSVSDIRATREGDLLIVRRRNA